MITIIMKEVDTRERDHAPFLDISKHNEYLFHSKITPNIYTRIAGINKLMSNIEN